MSTCSLPWQMATWRLLLWGLEAAASKDHDGRSQKTMGKIGTKSGIAKSKLYKSQLIFYCRSRKNDTQTCQFGSYFSHKSTEYLCFVMYMAYFGENMVFSRETFSRKDNERLHEHMYISRFVYVYMKVVYSKYVYWIQWSGNSKSRLDESLSNRPSQLYHHQKLKLWMISVFTQLRDMIFFYSFLSYHKDYGIIWQSTISNHTLMAWSDLRCAK